MVQVLACHRLTTAGIAVQMYIGRSIDTACGRATTSGCGSSGDDGFGLFSGRGCSVSIVGRGFVGVGSSGFDCLSVVIAVIVLWEKIQSPKANGSVYTA